MRALSLGFAAINMLWLASCTPPQPVTQSREIVWQQFGNQPVDNVLMAWGTPERETRLTNGSRMVTYQHSTIFDAGSPYERKTGCEVTFIAQPPKYRIVDVAMDGEAYECNLLAQGRTGSARHVAMPESAPYYPHRMYRAPF